MSIIKLTRYEKDLSQDDIKKLKDKEKKQTHKGLDNLIESIEKKKDLSSYDKSKKDWKDYVQDKQIEKELVFNRKDG